MTTFGPELVDPRSEKPLNNKVFTLDFFTGK
jgi:hypothetical protein